MNTAFAFACPRIHPGDLAPWKLIFHALQRGLSNWLEACYSHCPEAALKRAIIHPVHIATG